MTGTSTLTPRSNRPVPSRPPVGAPGGVDPAQRQKLLDRASGLDDQAKLAAERGLTEQAARLILQSLDCERRAGGLGPQVLQLIKPRG